MKKRIVSLLLVLTMMFTASAPAYAANGFEDLQIESFSESISTVAQSASNLNLSGLASAFKSVCGVAKGISTGLSLINGTVSFLKLIGVIEDPTQAAIANVLDELKTVNEKLDAMNKKLDGLAAQMSALQASVDFNERARQADYMTEAWKTFYGDYMENGLDDYMRKYTSMVLDGISNWCANEEYSHRHLSGIDSSKIILLYDYIEEDGSYQLSYTAANSVPAAYQSSGRYVVLSGDLLPEHFDWNVNTYHEDLTNEIAQRIYAALTSGNFDAFDAGNFPLLTEEGAADITLDDVMPLAVDAVNALVYRVSSAELNRSSSFALDVMAAFNSYCQHMFNVKEGLDAMYKSLYLTHSFEKEIADDLKAFADQMVVTTGSYGIFVMNMMGMSKYVRDDEKTDMLDLFNNMIAKIDETKSTGLTGYGDYCYLTNTRLKYGLMEFRSDLHAKTSEWKNIFGTYRRYESASLDPITPTIYYIKSGETRDFIGDSDALLLLNTLKSNGHTDYRSYLRENIVAENYGTFQECDLLVTSYTPEETMSFDNKTQLECYRIIGNWFKSKQDAHLNDLPGDSEKGYFKGRKQICGSTIDLDTADGNLETGKTLHAVALYAEGHGYWKKDEMAFYAGPSDYTGYGSSVNNDYLGDDVHRYTFYSRSRYNTLLLEPLPQLVTAAVSPGSEADGMMSYNPLDSFRELSRELKENNPPLGIATPPARVPQINSVDDLDLEGTVWHEPLPSDDKLLEGCTDLIDEAAAKAGLTSLPMTAEEKDALAKELMALCKSSEEELLANEALDVADPLGIGQNNDAVKALAAHILPSYLLNEDGSVSSKVTHLFVRLFYVPFPDVRFVQENGKWTPVVTMAYEVTPYLIVCETSSGKFDVQTLEISPELLQELGLSVTLRLPAGDAKQNATVRVRCLDNADDLNELTAVTAAPAGERGKQYVELTTDGSAAVYELSTADNETPVDDAAPNVPDCETPATGDESHTALYGALMLLSLAGLLCCAVYGRKRRENA